VRAEQAMMTAMMHKKEKDKEGGEEKGNMQS
jgi:hypothetical protein